MKSGSKLTTLSTKSFLSPFLFREYDLRGIVGDLIDEDVAYTLGLNYGSYVQDLGINKVIVGRDNRVSSPTLSKALIKSAHKYSSVVYLLSSIFPLSS